MNRDDLSLYLDDHLQVARIKDYCPNGLQVQGKPIIKTLVSGVTASLALIEEAIALKADAIMVHHGWFWKNDDARVIGQLHSRLKLLMDHEINLFAYHLPLDVHPVLGNNAQLAKVMGWKPLMGSKRASLGSASPMDGLIWEGHPEASQKTLGQLARSISGRLGRDPLVIGDLNKPIKRIAWCTGGAQGYINQAIEMKVDAYISGEVSEQTFHAAEESGVAYIAAGHHATERYGIGALGEFVAQKYKLKHQFVDIPNPV
ncbi:Nif3-like dinuclear metal center hexameric protein [Polynucleobacter cosmopolitanus]|uniref:Nif3-like dinuclear metal center hexameric protein n=1 Tax=Polynucleobacter cosmopolitanus TaxID=351345 RepID=A0A229FX66_9BURK|nr:Nif3-like dinuclear metal center hexameric protein [Polynucleobacter cosmopolitanus]OXL16544.1 Nif3-like dinuclear metal center hexameric protein [Polynucleobacter cosmopolitanus]